MGTRLGCWSVQDFEISIDNLKGYHFNFYVIKYHVSDTTVSVMQGLWPPKSAEKRVAVEQTLKYMSCLIV